MDLLEELQNDLRALQEEKKLLDVDEGPPTEIEAMQNMIAKLQQRVAELAGEQLTQNDYIHMNVVSINELQMDVATLRSRIADIEASLGTRAEEAGG